MILVAVIPGNRQYPGQLTHRLYHSQLTCTGRGPYGRKVLCTYLFNNYPGPSHAKQVQAYLKPFLSEIQSYGPRSSGFEVEDHSLPQSDTQRTFNFKLFVLNALADEPGLAQLLSCCDHKASSGCTKCTLLGAQSQVLSLQNHHLAVVIFFFSSGQVEAKSVRKRMQYDLTGDHPRLFLYNFIDYDQCAK